MRNSRWVTPVVIIGLLLVTALLTVISPAISQGISGIFAGGPAAPALAEAPEEGLKVEQVVINPEGYLLGDELVKIEPIGDYNRLAEADRTVSSLPLLGILAAAVLGGIALLTVPLGAIVWLGARSTTRMQADESYQKAAAAMENKQKALIKSINEAQPATPVPDHNRTVWSAWATGLVTVMLAYFAGLAIGGGIAESFATTMASIFATIAAVASFLLLRPKKMTTIEETSNNTPSWNLIYVLISGALMMGLGVGLMYVVISGGDPFPYITWEPQMRIDWSYFGDLLAPLIQ